MRMMLHIGLDDTDSPDSGCTTYVAAVLVEHLIDVGVEFVGYPTLLRLNPNTPWKTRGNAAVCLRFKMDDNEYGAVKDYVKNLVEQYGEFGCDNTNPGIVFLKGKVPEEIIKYSDTVVKSLVEKKVSENLITKHELDSIEYKNGRGIIGALAAIGGTLEGDYTYELLTYRSPENWGTPRRVDYQSVLKMDKELGESTYNNLDEKGNPMITPNGPDPVLYGVRGETPKAVYRAKEILKPLEPIERWMIYKTNQGTDQHFSAPIKISELETHNPAVVEGTVDTSPYTIRGGHVIFRLRDETGVVDCAAYEPTGGFRENVRKLAPGDRVTIFSSVSLYEKEYTLNIEKLVVTELAQVVQNYNPKCPECGGSTESMGRNQGLRCKKCGYRAPDLKKKECIVHRQLEKGIYLPDKGAQRHLTKPYDRYGREKIIL